MSSINNHFERMLVYLHILRIAQSATFSDFGFFKKFEMIRSLKPCVNIWRVSSGSAVVLFSSAKNFPQFRVLERVSDHYDIPQRFILISGKIIRYRSQSYDF
jgi:hypothetical protein